MRQGDGGRGRITKGGWRPHGEDKCVYRGEEVRDRIVDGCSSGVYLIDHSAFNGVKYTGTSSEGGSVELSSGKSVVVTSTLFSESENYDQGACLRAYGFSFARFEWDCFLKSKAAKKEGWSFGQTTYLTSQMNSSLHLSNTISECSPDINQGGYTIYMGGTHKSIISFNNFSNNKLMYSHAWCWSSGGEGTMNTLVNNEMGVLIYTNSGSKPNSISFTNIVENKNSTQNRGIFYIQTGSLTVFSSFIISNIHQALYDNSGSAPSFQDTLFHNNNFDASPSTDSLPFTYTLHLYQDWECGTKPVHATRKFSPNNSFLKKAAFVSFIIVNR